MQIMNMCQCVNLLLGTCIECFLEPAWQIYILRLKVFDCDENLRFYYCELSYMYYVDVTFYRLQKEEIW